jgi:TRAP-type C4-dicarboxylate transport system permease small subunit
MENSDVGRHGEPVGPVRSGSWASVMSDNLENAIIALSGCAFVVISALIMAQVFFRYVLAAPPIWTEELTRYFFVWLAWLSAAVVFRRGHHVTIEAITNLVPEAIRPVHDALIRLVCVAILLFLLRYGVDALTFATNRSAALNIPMFYVYASAPVAAFIMLTFAALDAIHSHLAGRRSHVN